MACLCLDYRECYKSSVYEKIVDTELQETVNGRLFAWYRKLWVVHWNNWIVIRTNILISPCITKYLITRLYLQTLIEVKDYKFLSGVWRYLQYLDSSEKNCDIWFLVVDFFFFVKFDASDVTPGTPRIIVIYKTHSQI